MKRKYLWLSLALGTIFALSACSGLIPGSGQPDVNQAATQEAIIIQAVKATATTMAMETEISQLQTKIAGGDAAQPATATQAAATAPVLDTPAPTATGLPPTNTPVPPTATLIPITVTPILPTFTPSATAMPCNMATFVQDVTISDGSVITAGSSFTKTWRLRNTGACTWTTQYDIVFSGGDSMSAPAVIDMPGNVAPGQVIDISVNMVAPSTETKYRGEWKLRDGAGAIFGLGKTNAPFYVEIRVAAANTKYPLDMVASMCQAEWTNGSGSLNCPGAENDSRGYVLRVDKPVLESGYVDDEAAILTYPQMIDDGVIRGKYPSYRVESGHHFLAIIGCEGNVDECDVNFRLDYQIGSEAIQTLATWREKYDKQFQGVDVDLSSLSGKDVRFILTVLANGSSKEDKALWLAPRVEKK